MWHKSTSVFWHDDTIKKIIYEEKLISNAVFKQNKKMYYALTAYHVVKNYPNAEYFIIPYGAPTYSEYRKQSNVHVPNEEYYGQFKKATGIHFL